MDLVGHLRPLSGFSLLLLSLCLSRRGAGNLVLLELRESLGEFGRWPASLLARLARLARFLASFRHQDACQRAGTSDDWALSVSASWVFEERWVPFQRGGWADEGTSLYQVSVSAELGYVNRHQDVIGFGVN